MVAEEICACCTDCCAVVVHSQLSGHNYFLDLEGRLYYHHLIIHIEAQVLVNPMDID